jgi:hypothetical protein
MTMRNENIKAKVIGFRKAGKTYGEIRKILGINIPKSTLSYWCAGVLLSKIQKIRIEKRKKINIYKGHLAALVVNRARREKYLKSVEDRISYLSGFLKNKGTGKLVLGALYLGEGSKHRAGSLMFGNSDLGIIKSFLYIFRSVYDIDEKKFRCTVQCRADQNTKKLERFWSMVTKIPSRQFYKTRVDARTIGKKTKN